MYSDQIGGRVVTPKDRRQQMLRVPCKKRRRREGSDRSWVIKRREGTGG